MFTMTIIIVETASVSFRNIARAGLRGSSIARSASNLARLMHFFPESDFPLRASRLGCAVEMRDTIFDGVCNIASN